MTYHEREFLVSKSTHSPQNYSRRKVFNDSNNELYPCQFSTLPLFRVECRAEEQHFMDGTSPYNVNSMIKPIHLTIHDPQQPIKFRSEIIIHNDPNVDLRVKNLRVAFHFRNNPEVVTHDQNLTPLSNTNNEYNPPKYISLQPKDYSTRHPLPPSGTTQSQMHLHRWVDDICANEELMANDDIVFFIKNGEFFARI